MKVLTGTVIAAATVLHLSMVIFGKQHEVYFGVMVGEHEGAKSGIEDALNSINQRSDLLPGHTLKYIDSKIECNRTEALKKLFAEIFHFSHDKNLVALIGSGCSVTTEATAEISHYFNITELSCVSSSDELNDRMRFPYYFQLLPSEVNLARVFYSFIKEYGWRRVALIVQNQQRYKVVARSLKDMTQKGSRKTITYIENIIETNHKLSTKLFDPQSRIFVIFADSKHARSVICLAYELEMKYPKHLFLTYGSYESYWWTREDGLSHHSNCTPRDRAEVLQFSFAALQSPPPMMKHSRGAVRDPVWYISRDNEVYIHCYDAALALALALNKAINELNNMRQPAGSRLLNNDTHTFTYDTSIFQLMKTYLDETNFTGLSGPVHFNENGIRLVSGMTILQYRTTYVNGTSISDGNTSSFATIDQKLRLVAVAHIRANENELKFLDKNYSFWPNIIPYDGIPKSEPSSVILHVGVTVILLNTGGLAFALLCLVFNIVHRNKKLIRLNSPNLNYLMIIGISLVYLGAIIFAIPSTNPKVVVLFCLSRMWLLTFGYTCGFGIITAKLGRIYHIFRNPQAKKGAIRDHHLMLFVFLLLLMSAVIMFLHILLEGFVSKFSVAKFPNLEKPFTVDGELDIKTNYFIYQCSSHSWIRYFMQAVIFMYMCILHIVALCLAFKTRKVKVKGLNDAKYAAVVVYITTFIMVFTLVIAFTLSNYITAYAAVFGGGMWIGCTIILAIIFVPKMMRILKDPEGETVFTAHEEALQITSAHDGLQDDEVINMKKKLKEMEGAVMAYKRITGLDLLTNNTLTSSVSMINLHMSYNKGQLQKRNPQPQE